MSNEAPKADWDAIARYLAGESSTAERESVQRWLASQPADSKLIAALDEALDGIALPPEAVAGIDVNAAWAKTNARRAGTKSVRSFPATRSWQMPTAIAAALVIAVGSLVLVNKSQTATTPTIAAREIITPVGKRDSLVLPDGSMVLLGPGSRLTIASGYDVAERRVALHGEAFFDVKHDVAHPFVVDANGATIRDIGTSFVVHTDSTGGVRVVVKSGIVALSRTAAGQGSTTLRAGDVATVSVDGSVAAQPGAANADDLAWTQGKLIFRDATLAEVRDDLRRWYGIELAVRDSAMLKRHFTATFNGDSVGHVLNVLSLALGATIDRRGDTALVRVSPENARKK